MKNLFLFAALCVAAAFSSCKHDDSEPVVVPETTPLAIAFAEGNSLEFDVNETQTVHYTITGGSDDTVVTAELQTADDAYAVETTPASATEGTIAITAKTPETENCVVVTVSDGDRSVTAEIAVSTKPITVVVETPGTLKKLLADCDQEAITELILIGNLNNSDIATLKSMLPNLAVLDMENANLEEMNYFVLSQKTSLTSVKLPNTLKTIGTCVFQDCKGLTNITIPGSVTEIGQGAFDGCSGLIGITILEGVASIGDSAFQGCSSLTSITIPNSVTSIGASVFCSCRSLTSVTIPNGVPVIGDHTFSTCSSLTSVTIPDSVTEIGQDAFAACRSLTSITIPGGVTKIGHSAFLMSGLTSIYCKAQTPPSVGTDVLKNVRATLYVPTGCKEAYAAAEGWSAFKTIEEFEF